MLIDAYGYPRITTCPAADNIKWTEQGVGGKDEEEGNANDRAKHVPCQEEDLIARPSMLLFSCCFHDYTVLLNFNDSTTFFS